MKNKLAFYLLAGTLLGLLLWGNPNSADAAATQQQKELSLYLDSIYAMTDQEKKELDIAPFLVNDTTLFPLRVFAEHFGAKVTWMAANQRIDIHLKGQVLTMQIGEKHMWLNGGAAQIIEAAPVIVKDVTVLPLRILSEAFQKEIFYDSGLIIVSSEKVNPSKEHIDELIEELSQGVNLHFRVHQDGKPLEWFHSFKEAVDKAKWYLQSSVTYKEKVVWSNQTALPFSYRITGVPYIYQMPELDRGCEVTALAMMLNYAGVYANKMNLAKEVHKDPTPYQFKNGGVYFGNPNTGFVGDIYSFENSGYGVYHGPVKLLAERYLPDRIVDMTNAAFNDILFAVSQGKPVWVINNTKYNTLPDSQWRKWATPTGDVYITYSEHSVVITGYDDTYIYINDPLGVVSKVSKAAFEKGWNQMGKQAITYVN